MTSVQHIDLYALPVWICGFLIIIVGYYKLTKLRKTNNTERVFIFEVWLIGLIAFLFGVFGQISKMKEGFNAIAVVGDINATIVAEAISNSYRYTINGLLFLICSLIVWGVLKSVKSKRYKDD